jgi:hypothetical protein
MRTGDVNPVRMEFPKFPTLGIHGFGRLLAWEISFLGGCPVRMVQYNMGRPLPRSDRPDGIPDIVLTTNYPCMTPAGKTG